MKKLIILGSSGIVMIATSIADELEKYEVYGFFNDVMQVETQIGKYKKLLDNIL